MKLMLQELVARREALVQRSAQQRAQIAQAAAGIQRSLSVVDAAVGIVRRVTKPPFGIAIGAALLWLLGPRRAVSWLGRGFALISFVRPLQQFVRAMSNVSTKNGRPDKPSLLR